MYYIFFKFWATEQAQIHFLNLNSANEETCENKTSLQIKICPLPKKWKESHEVKTVVLWWKFNLFNTYTDYSV